MVREPEIHLQVTAAFITRLGLWVFFITISLFVTFLLIVYGRSHGFATTNCKLILVLHSWFVVEWNLSELTIVLFENRYAVSFQTFATVAVHGADGCLYPFVHFSR